MASPTKPAASRRRSLRALPLGRVDGVSPLFIVGMPRSGTTLLRLIVNAHPEFAVAGESSVFRRTGHYGPLSTPTHLRRFVDDLTPLFTLQSPHPDLLEDEDLLGALSRSSSYAEALNLVMSAYAEREGKPRWGEKTPSHVRRVGLIFAAFPNAQVVHIVRDPRAVIVSIQQTFGDASFSNSTVYYLSRSWRRSITLLDRYQGARDRYTTLRYEDLVRQPDSTLRALCEFLGVDYSRAMLDFHQDAIRYVRLRPDGTMNPAHATTLQALREDRAERWREVLAPRHTGMVAAVAGDVMTRFGYRLEPETGRLPGRSRRLVAATGANWRVARGRLWSLSERARSAVRRLRRGVGRKAPPGGDE